MRVKKKPDNDDIRTEYEFDYSKAVRGKYCQRLLKEKANVAILEPDVAKSFRDSAAVNEALRSLLELTNSTKRLTRRSTKGEKKLQVR
jgi:flagellar motility protein MotE (MotC chaperone)